MRFEDAIMQAIYDTKLKCQCLPRYEDWLCFSRNEAFVSDKGFVANVTPYIILATCNHKPEWEIADSGNRQSGEGGLPPPSFLSERR
jgi:hypothetical protein